MVPSAVVTLVVRLVIAEAFVTMSPSASVRSDCRVVISVDWEVIVPSAVVTRVSSALIAEALVVISLSASVRSD